MKIVDPIQVYLGYPVLLKTRLNLPIDVEKMLFKSGLTEQDLNAAEEFVNSQINDIDQVSAHLVEDGLWIETLKSIKSEQMTKLEKAKEAAEDEGAYLRYQEELKALTKAELTNVQYFS